MRIEYKLDLREMHELAQRSSGVTLFMNRFEQLVGEAIEVLFGFRPVVDLTAIFSSANCNSSERLWVAESTEQYAYVTAVQKQLQLTLSNLGVSFTRDRLLEYTVTDWVAKVAVASSAIEWLTNDTAHS